MGDLLETQVGSHLLGRLAGKQQLLGGLDPLFIQPILR